VKKPIGLILVATLFLLVIFVGWYLLYLFRPPLKPTYGFLQDDPCTLPCWENITPGKSSELDALKELIKRKLFSSDSASYLSDDWFHFFTQMDDEVSIIFLNEQVQRIDFNPNVPLPLNTMIEILGEPEKIYIDTTGEHQILCHESYLYYPKHGLRIEAATCEDFNRASRLKNGNVMPDTLVTALSFVEVATNSEIMLESFNLPEDQLQEISSNMVNWNGYGYYPP